MMFIFMMDNGILSILQQIIFTKCHLHLKEQINLLKTYKNKNK